MADEHAFNCSMCGRCCAQRLVLLNAADVYRLAGHFGMDAEGFMQEYGVVFTTTAETRNPRLYLKVEGNVCRFFSQEKGCSIHDVKPLICRLFPAIKPGITAGEVKEYVRGHSLDGGVLSCAVFDMPDDAVLKVDKETLITSVICDSLESVYYSGYHRSDIDFLYRMMTMADRPDVRKLVSDYLFEGDKESGLTFEHAVFEIQSALQAIDWGKVPQMTPCHGIVIENGAIYVYVDDAVSKGLFDKGVNGDLEALSCQPDPSVADNNILFLSLAIKALDGPVITMAFPVKKDDLRSAAPDGKFTLHFYPVSVKDADVCALKAYIDPSVL